MLKKIIIFGLGYKFASAVFKKVTYQIFMRKKVNLKDYSEPINLYSKFLHKGNSFISTSFLTGKQNTMIPFVYPINKLNKNNSQRLKELTMPFYCQVNNSEINILNFYNQIEQMNNKLKKHMNETLFTDKYLENLFKIYFKTCLNDVNKGNNSFFLFVDYFIQKNNNFSSIYTGTSLSDFNLYHTKVVHDKLYYTLELSLELDHQLKIFTSIVENNYKMRRIPKYIYFLSKSYSNSEDSEFVLKIDVYMSKDLDNFKFFNDSVVVRCFMELGTSCTK